MQNRFHPQREVLFNELHSRPFPIIDSPARVSQLTVVNDLNDPEFNEKELAHITTLCQRYSINPPSSVANCYYHDFGGFECRWERHREFSTYTFIQTGHNPQPFQRTVISSLPETWLNTLPGEIISGLEIEIDNMPAETVDVDDLRHYFEGHRLLTSNVYDEQAQLWTAYRLHGDGMGRLLIHNKSLNSCQTGRLICSLIEFETYRMMAQMALPIALKILPEARKMDQQLASIINQVAELETIEDERHLLTELTILASKIEQNISDTNYRFSATNAYYGIAKSRLVELRETEINGRQTLTEFLERRLLPAFRTCESAHLDLEELAKRTDHASDLLRTRVHLTIEQQNQDLLHSMDKRGQIQLKMQQVVEGLSVAVITYHFVGLIGYCTKAAEKNGLIDDATSLTALAIVPTLFIVWFGLHRTLKNINKEP